MEIKLGVSSVVPGGFSGRFSGSQRIHLREQISGSQRVEGSVVLGDSFEGAN